MKKPNAIQTILACAACKFTRFFLRKTGRGGTAVPGIVAMKLSRDILSAVTEGMSIVIVTGTNGKTTTCNMIAHALQEAGRNCLLNKSGANMLHGMAADLICNTDWRGRPKSPCAVLECDEAALKLIVPFFSPAAIVVTNLFSDQVDRYGGVQNTLKEIRAGVELSPKSVLVLNADEPLSASLARNVPNDTVWYGMEASVPVQGNVDLSDAGVCPECGGAYSYDYHIYAHLGGYRCPACGYHRPAADVAVTAIEHADASGTLVQIRVGGESHTVSISLPAVYNVYNAAGSLAAAIAMGVPVQKAIASLGSVRSSFGRLETFTLGGNRIQMILVKNPAGCNQAFSYVTGFDEDFTAVLCLNNRTGDGHDFSWIDVTDYEKLCADPHLKKIYVGGDCINELYGRLKKAGAREAMLVRITDYQELIRQLGQEGRPVYILPNYTAMMEVRQVLSQATGSKDFWE